MFDWEWECFEGFLNNGLFEIVDCGPLSVPINAFSICRNEELRLMLSTEADYQATSSSPSYPAGTVRENTDSVTFANSMGTKITAHGVDRCQWTKSIGGSNSRGELKEQWSVHRLEGLISEQKQPAYVIEWLANVEGAYLWPDSTDKTTEVRKTLKFSSSPGGPVPTSSGTRPWLSRNCAKLRVDSYELYLCSTQETPTANHRKTGFILYVGNPPAALRQKIRDCLSFALGAYLVYLGCSSFGEEWEILSFTASSPYSMGGTAFRLPTLPPAPLGKQYEWEIKNEVLSRFVESILAHYTPLKFGSLSWAYWHAVCATSHIAPVHFGAAIEALQRRYVRASEKVDTTLLGAGDWTALKKVVEAAIPTLSAIDDVKTILTNKVCDLNKAPQSVITERTIAAIGIALSEREKRAWKRRNIAAHGSEPDDAGTIELIREIKVLRVLFHRMLLAITKASDSYYDYYSLGRPTRRVQDPVP